MHKRPTFTESQLQDSAEQMKQRFSGYSEHYFQQSALTQHIPTQQIEVGDKPNSENKMPEVTREELAARLETIEVRMDSRLATIESKIDAKFAELRTDMHKGTAELVKWVVGTAIAMAAVAITVMTFVLNNAVPKAPSMPPAQPQPIVIYPQPATAASSLPTPPVKP